jgi:hypothetical protein
MFNKVVLLSLAITLFFIPALAVAQSDGTLNSSEERLSRALNSNQIKLDDEARLELSNKCKNAQIIIRQLQIEAEKSVILRIKTYSSINADLQAIKLRMLRQGSDASETELLTGKMQQIIDQFTVDADKYGTTLNDLVSIDCTEKPELFLAGLLLARTQRTKLYSESTSIKSLVNNSNQTIFYQLKKRLML